MELSIGVTDNCQLKLSETQVEIPFSSTFQLSALDRSLLILRSFPSLAVTIIVLILEKLRTLEP